MRVLLLFFIVCSLVFQTYAQLKTFHIGLKAEFYGYTSQEVYSCKTYSKKFNLAPLPAMYVLVSKDLSELISLTLKPGISFRPITGNVELGLVIDYKIFENKYFLVSGINIYFVNEKFFVCQSEIESDNIYFILLGIGYKLTDRLSVDISFHQALNQEFAFYSYYDEGPSKLLNMVKLGLAATF
jgi:hypothetical protein